MMSSHLATMIRVQLVERPLVHLASSFDSNKDVATGLP
jgi:hypothetical protein